MSQATLHEKFMRTALLLAQKGAGRVSPNPMVGAVLVKNGAIVGKGYHEFFGGPHAEINAIKHAGAKARGADLYINLEPCSHFGKTPPCADALIAQGIKKVFIGMVDPNPAVSEGGIQKLKKAGISVEVGLLENQCRRLNESFIKFITKKIPFVTLKAALTLDGNIATSTGDSKWITSEQSRARAHKMRNDADVVMVGIGTVLADDPLLTVRLYKGAIKNPLRVIVDGKLRIPLTCKMLQPEYAPGTLIATSPEKALSKKARAITAKGAQVVGIPQDKYGVDLKKLMKLLGKMGIASILLEGGSELNASALACGVVDKVSFFYAPKIIGGANAVHVVGGYGIQKIAAALMVKDITLQQIGSDFLVEGYIKS